MIGNDEYIAAPGDSVTVVYGCDDWNARSGAGVFENEAARWSADGWRLATVLRVETGDIRVTITR